jgi:hypothetical protein
MFKWKMQTHFKCPHFKTFSKNILKTYFEHYFIFHFCPKDLKHLGIQPPIMKKITLSHLWECEFWDILLARSPSHALTLLTNLRLRLGHYKSINVKVYFATITCLFTQATWLLQTGLLSTFDIKKLERFD